MKNIETGFFDSLNKNYNIKVLTDKKIKDKE